MGRRRKDEEEKSDAGKPCRCGSGYYCHRHKRYGTSEMLTPKLEKVSRAKRPCKVGRKTGPSETS